MDKKKYNNKESLIQRDTAYALGLYKRVCTVLGIWPTKNRTLTGIQIGIYIVFHVSLKDLNFFLFSRKINTSSITQTISLSRKKKIKSTISKLIFLTNSFLYFYFFF